MLSVTSVCYYLAVPIFRGSDVYLAAYPTSAIETDGSRGRRNSSQEEQVGGNSHHSGMETILREGVRTVAVTITPLSLTIQWITSTLSLSALNQESRLRQRSTILSSVGRLLCGHW